jgi:uncharacterized protein (DUF2164 family)
VTHGVVLNIWFACKMGQELKLQSYMKKECKIPLEKSCIFVFLNLIRYEIGQYYGGL